MFEPSRVVTKVIEDKVRVAWDDELQEWFFSVVDAVEVLTDSKVPKDYLKKMRKREPELSINQAVQDWRRLGYSESWINNRIKSIEVRKGLTDEWDRAGVQQGQQCGTSRTTGCWTGCVRWWTS